MDQHSIDKEFKEALFNHKTALDKDALWAAIEQKQKRKFGWLFFSFAALIALISIIGLLKLNDANYQNSKGDISNFSVAENSDPQPNLDGNHEIMTPTQIESVPSEESKNRSASHAALTLNKNQYLVNQNNYSKVGTSLSKKIISSKAFGEKKSAELNPTNFGTSSEKTVKKIQSSTSILRDAATSNNFTHTSQSVGTTTLMDGLTDIQSLSPSTPVAFMEHESKTVNLNKKIKCYDHGKPKLNYSIIGYGSVDYVLNRFAANSDELAYRDERDATQTQLEGYRTGLQLKALTSKGFYVKAGLELGVINERFDDEIEETFTEIRPNQLLEVIEQADTTILIFGDAPFDVTRTTTFKVFNTYRTIGVPFSFGYQLDAKGYFYGIEIGGIYDFNYKFSGTLLDTSLVPNNDVSDYFINSNLASLTGGFQFGYRWKEKISILASCTFKHNLANVNNGENSLNQSNTRIGLGLGLEYKL